MSVSDEHGRNATSSRAIVGIGDLGNLGDVDSDIDVASIDERRDRTDGPTNPAVRLTTPVPTITPRSALRTTTLAHAAVVGLLVVLGLGACGADDTDRTAAPTTTSMLPAQPVVTAAAQQPSGAGAVAIAEFAFVPSPVTVPPGGTVTWTNNDEAAHSVNDASPMGTPASKSLKKGETFSNTYPKPGTYAYVCGIHNYMQGSVEVKG